MRLSAGKYYVCNKLVIMCIMYMSEFKDIFQRENVNISRQELCCVYQEIILY